MKVSIRKTDTTMDGAIIAGVALVSSVAVGALGVLKNDENLQNAGTLLGVASIAVSSFTIGMGTTIQK